MNHKKFTKLFERRVALSRDVLASKSAEYSTSDDKLFNFRQAARILDTTPAKALQGMFSKHLVSLFDLISGRTKPSQYLIDEKIGDCINYLILLEAIITEGLKDE